MPPEQKERSPWRQVAFVIEMGLRFAAAVVVGVVLGLWLDGKFETKPLLTLLFCGLGFAAGFLDLLRELKRLDQQ